MQDIFFNEKSDLTFKKLLRCETLDDKKDFIPLLMALSGKMVNVLGTENCVGRRVLNISEVKVYRSEANELLDSGTVPTIIFKLLEESLSVVRG